jgi:hypothetical protein
MVKVLVKQYYFMVGFDHRISEEYVSGQAPVAEG